MSDELTPEMREEATPDLLTLEDEDGQEVTFEVIDATEEITQRISDKLLQTKNQSFRFPYSPL